TRSFGEVAVRDGRRVATERGDPPGRRTGSAGPLQTPCRTRRRGSQGSGLADEGRIGFRRLSVVGATWVSRRTWAHDLLGRGLQAGERFPTCPCRRIRGGKAAGQHRLSPAVQGSRQTTPGTCGRRRDPSEEPPPRAVGDPVPRPTCRERDQRRAFER